MKVWKIYGTAVDGRKWIRYRATRADALSRQSRARQEGSTVDIKLIETPESRFRFIDFLNCEMSEVEE